MNTIGDRLATGVAVLQVLDRRRSETASPRWGYHTECWIVNQELRELEADIEHDPGALETQLVRVRRGRLRR